MAKDADYTARLYSEVVDNGEYEGKKYDTPLYVSKTLLFLIRS